jgi:hypothetical protein
LNRFGYNFSVKPQKLAHEEYVENHLRRVGGIWYSVQLGRMFRKFYAKNGQEVILRTPRLDDLDELMNVINSLIDERAEIARTEKVTREQEAEWLPKMLAHLEKEELFWLLMFLVAHLLDSQIPL